MNDRQDLKWDGLKLRLKSGRLLATVEPDAKWPKMYRVRLPDGHVTDMVNLSRARDAARHLALRVLVVSHAEAPPMRPNSVTANPGG